MFDSGARSEQQRSTAPVDVDAIMLGFRDSSRLSSEALDACKVMMTAAQNLTEQELVAVVTSLLAHRAEAKRALRDLWAHKSAAPPDCDTAPPQSAARQSTPESTADSSHRGCGDTIGAFKAMMTAPRHMTHQAGATVQLRNANGTERLLVFSQRPLNIKYKNELPIVVSFVGADGEGARQGVEVGDTLLACNGVTFQGKDVSECHHLLQDAFNSLPYSRARATSISL